jgi:thiol-disulfide isomerase/thioredoxin
MIKKILKYAAIGIGVLFIVSAVGLAMYQSGLFATKEAKAFSEKLVELDAKTFPDILAKDRPTLVFVYASWCPYCKEQFGVLESLSARFGNDVLHIAYISVDENPYELSQTLVDKYEKGVPFTPYHVSPMEKDGFYQGFESYGFKPNGGIPYLLLFDSEQKPKQQFYGLTSPLPLTEEIRKLVK